MCIIAAESVIKFFLLNEFAYRSKCLTMSSYAARQFSHMPDLKLCKKTEFIEDWSGYETVTMMNDDIYLAMASIPGIPG